MVFAYGFNNTYLIITIIMCCDRMKKIVDLQLNIDGLLMGGAKQ